MTFHKSIKKFFSITVLLLVAVLVVGCDSKNLAEEKAELIYIGSKDEVNGSFALPKFVQGEETAPIEWTSSNTTAVSIEEFADWDDAFDHSKFVNAKVTLAAEEVKLELTAVVTVGKDKATVKFPVTLVADLYTEKTISEAKAMALKSLVKIEGTVSYTGDSGYIVVNEDRSDQYFVYRGTGVKVGDVVVVRGETAEYQKMPQLANSAFEKIDQVQFDVNAEADAMTLAEVNAHSNTDKSFYSKLVKLEGLLVKTSDSNKPWVIQDPLDARVKVFINKYTSAKSVETINANLDKFITVNAVLYDNRDDTFTLLLPDTFPAGTTYEYDDEKNAIRTLNELLADFKDAIVTEDLDLPVENTDREATIVWESSNVDVLANDGTVTVPNDDTKVTLTITVTIGEKEKTGTVEVTVKQLPVSKIEDLIALTPAKA
ncbi:MAG: immunoglobulin-like domain-containing protein, partial [Bacilli bacterium]